MRCVGLTGLGILFVGMNEVRPLIHDCYVQYAVPGTAIVNVVIELSAA